MRNSGVVIGILLLIVGAISASSASALPIGPDTFQDGTTRGWFVPGPSPNPPANVATGGPGGVGDAFMLLTANGTNGPGGRLVALNDTQWTGDFLAAGITAIKMDVRNFGTTDLVLRLLFENFGAAPPPTDIAVTLVGVTVPAGSGWTSVIFDLSLANLGVETFGTVAGALGDVNTLRIFHNPNPAFPGPGVGIPAINAALGIDNIAVVPEPGTALLVGGALAIFLIRRRRSTGSAS